MTKYWNAARIRRIKKRTEQATERSVRKLKAEKERGRSFTSGDAKKNAQLMLDALGLSLRRRMVARLRRGGAMSLSKLADPYGITLPTALVHIQCLERSGLVTTHKHGRIRMCMYRAGSFEELAHWIATDNLRSIM